MGGCYVVEAEVKIRKFFWSLRSLAVTKIRASAWRLTHFIRGPPTSDLQFPGGLLAIGLTVR